MSSICFYFQLHQPLRINPEANKLDELFSYNKNGKLNNKLILEQVVERCYLPATEMMFKLIKRHPEFKISYSLSGVLIEQLARNHSNVINLFKKLADTGRVEFFNETYYHSLSSLYSKNEFTEQIKYHKAVIKDLFNQEPEIFRNTEIIYSNDIGTMINNLGYKVILAEGADRIIGWMNPNFLFKGISGINLLLKNYKLSDDIAFRFADKSFFDYPMTTDKYFRRVDAINSLGNDLINLFMDYETFGEHQAKETGIFEFFEALIDRLINDKMGFINPSETYKKLKVKQIISMPGNVSWADHERDTSAWTSNEMQKESLEKIYSLEDRVKSKGDNYLLDIWRKLQTSDHFYFMCTKKYGGENSDIDVHSYFSPFGTPRKCL